ncbi:MAG: 2-hydroxyacyl-CoA dehydratase family protein [Candidatus Binatia bacterium]|nr:2-hydroxyacyl-CoA dehydratase family protein [Candidatus Binatia bacterium]
MAECKGRGGKVIGYTCTYVPEEIVYAAGMFPLRIFGGAEDTFKGEELLQVNLCSFVRSCMGEALEGNYDFLDGLVMARVCSHTTKLYDVWELYLSPSLTHIIDQPHRISDRACSFYAGELQKFVSALERAGGKKVTAENLREAVRLCNESRSLLRELYEFRKEEPPRISGSKSLQMVRASQLLPKKQGNALLKKVLTDLRERGEISRRSDRPRLLLTGSVIDNLAFVEAVEEAGADVVCDDLCVGSRSFWDLVEIAPGGYPIEALSRHYVEKIPCPHIHPQEHRFQHILEMARHFHAQGAIIFNVKFCDTSIFGSPGCIELLRQEGIPSLELEIEHSTVALGQIRTRVQAFLEMLKGARQET